MNSKAHITAILATFGVSAYIGILFFGSILEAAIATSLICLGVVYYTVYQCMNDRL